MGKFKNDKKTEIEEIPKKTNIQRLMDIINNRIDSGIRKPVPMPENQQEAAKWVISILEPRMQFEIATDKCDPYQERLAECLIAFYRLPHVDQIQIVEWSKQKIMWRGDKMNFMRKRAKVTPEMLADKGKLKSMLHKIVAKGSFA